MTTRNCAPGNHKYDWRDCEKPDHEEGCFVATCELCGLESYDCCEHRSVRWLHHEVESECDECQLGHGDPCSAIVCTECGESVEPSTDAHHRQLVDTA